MCTIHCIQVVMAIRLLSTYVLFYKSTLGSILFLLAFIAGIVPLVCYSGELNDDCDEICIECSGDNNKCDEATFDNLDNVTETSLICMVRYS